MAEAGYVTNPKSIVVSNMPIYIEEQWCANSGVNIGLCERNVYESIQCQLVSRKNHSDSRQNASGFWFKLPVRDDTNLPSLGVNLFQFEQGNCIASVFDSERDWNSCRHSRLKWLVEQNSQPRTLHNFQTRLGNTGTFARSISGLAGKFQPIPHIACLFSVNEKLHEGSKRKDASKRRNPPIGRRWILFVVTDITVLFVHDWGCRQIDGGRRFLGWMVILLSYLSFALAELLFLLTGFSWTWDWVW